MKKSLLVLAVAAAVPVLAQAQTNVTLYGRVDASVGSESRGTTSAVTGSGATAIAAGTKGGSAVSLLSGVQSSNRWGVRGSEDLGGGLKAIFNLESGFDADVGRGFGQATQNSGISNSSGGLAAGATTSNTAGGLDFRRRSVVGLEGGFGSLVFGRDYDPVFRVLLGSDTLGLGHYANVHTIVGASTAFAGQRTYGVRIDNGLHYVTPSLGGFVVRAAYGFSEQFNTSAGSAAVAQTATSAAKDAVGGYTKSTGRAVSLAAEYAAGPLYVGLGYRANTVAAGPSATLAALQTGTDKFITLGARYNFGAFAVNGGYQRSDLANGVNGAVDSKSIWIGGDVQAGPGRLHAQFGRIDPTGAGKASTIGITYNYPLSKRTNAYATLGQVKNNSSTNYALGTSSTTVFAAGNGGDPRGIALGVGHNF
jgi:predicted porin